MNIDSQLTNIKKLKKFIFDPLSTIIKLAILGNKHSGSKITIKDNIIYIQESGFNQSFSRYYYGDSKSDLHYLSIPIEISCKKYLTQIIIKRIPKIIILFKTSQNGLIKLMNTYKQFPIIIHCLKYYYSIIETHLNELLHNSTYIDNISNDSVNFMTETLKTQLGLSSNSQSVIINNNMSSLLIPPTDSFIPIKINEEINKEINEEINEEKTIIEIGLVDLYDEKLLNKFNQIWTDTKINIIICMIEYLLKENLSIDYAGCVETFMIPIDKNIINIINNNYL